MMIRIPLMISGLVLILCVVAPAQTSGIDFLNSYFASPPGVITFPVQPVPPGLVVPLLPSTPFQLTVTTRAPGLLVMIFASLAPSCGISTCLPPIAGPYSAIPMVCSYFPGPTGSFSVPSNQSVDICAAGLGFQGFSVPGLAPPGAGVFETAVFTTPPVSLGLSIRTQAVILDPTVSPLLFGIVVTNAFTLTL